MKHLAFVFFLLAATVKFYAQPYSLTAVKGKVKNGYNFWLYTPKDYQAGQKTPVIVFLHPNRQSDNPAGIYDSLASIQIRMITIILCPVFLPEILFIFTPN